MRANKTLMTSDVKPSNLWVGIDYSSSIVFSWRGGAWRSRLTQRVRAMMTPFSPQNPLSSSNSSFLPVLLLQTRLFTTPFLFFCFHQPPDRQHGRWGGLGGVTRGYGLSRALARPLCVCVCERDVVNSSFLRGCQEVFCKFLQTVCGCYKDKGQRSKFIGVYLAAACSFRKQPASKKCRCEQNETLNLNIIFQIIANTASCVNAQYSITISCFTCWLVQEVQEKWESPLT